MTALAQPLVVGSSSSGMALPRALPATERDREFLRTLFADCLSPFYGGDHHAHADRVLNAHLAFGHDPFGHFSVAQRTFVLWSPGGQDAHRMGVLHLVRKRQGTVKISPLILAPAFRNRSGLGRLLLDVAEQFARAHEARQLYCTVAATNEAALGFFLGNGFLFAGGAPDQYKPGVTERMLYKDISPETCVPGRPEADVGVRIRLFAPEDADALRDLVLNAISGAYCGVDTHWVDALIAGHGRRSAGDVNQKFKIIYVAAAQDGTIRGIAAGGPKKGEPVKVMPLCADSTAVFKQLLDAVPTLFGGLGRKLYTHLPPNPAVTAQMQAHGWLLEGLMPAAYHPDSCTVQWGLARRAEPDQKADYDR